MSQISSSTPPTRRALFTTFLLLGITGFGGVLPLSRRMIVERRGWLDASEFAELLALCQFLPGGNIINMSVLIGRRFRGATGSLCAASGLLAGPTVLVVAVWSLYVGFAALPLVQGAMLGLAAGASGLLIGMALRLLLPLRTRWAAASVALAVLVAVWAFGVPLVVVLLVATPLSVAVMRPPAEAAQ